MSEPKGQILPDSAFGRVLTELSMTSETIVEIGGWHGQGSTKCLANGLIRPTQRMWSIESDKAMHEEAKGYYDDPRITFLHGLAMDIFLTDILPQQIDLILFDGSDDTTDDEFEVIWKWCKVICLDDTKEMKNRLQRKRVLTHPKIWTVLHDVLTERNGWMVAQRL